MIGRFGQRGYSEWLPWACALFAVLFFSTLKSVRAPIDYPATMYLLNYSEGFVKRGLFGSIVFGGDGPVTQGQITLLSFVILGALLCSLGAIGILMMVRRPELGPLTLLFASSVSIVYFAGTTGYFDHVLVIMAVIVILPARESVRAVLTLCLGVIALLIHEGAAFMVLPLMYFALFVESQKRGAGAALRVCIPIMAIHVVLTAYLSLFALLEDTSLAQLKEGLQARADFNLDDLAFYVLSVTPVDDMMRVLEQHGLRDHLLSLVTVAPALLPMLYVSTTGLRNMPLAAPGIVWALWAAACLTPCILRFWGTDLHRWDSLAICTSFLAVFVVVREMPESFRFGLDHGWKAPALLLMIVMSASTTTLLFWGREIRWYPFVDF